MKGRILYAHSRSHRPVCFERLRSDVTSKFLRSCCNKAALTDPDQHALLDWSECAGAACSLRGEAAVMNSHSGGSL